jgi:hypothetical protein
MTRVLPQPVIAERYIQALGGADPIESQRKAPKRVRKLVKGMSAKQLARRPEEGKWSIKEVLAHLAEGEMVLGSRIRYVAAMDRPQIVGYDQDAFVRNLRYDDVEAHDLLEAFTALRALNVALLERLPDDAFARIGLHTERGEESLSSMVHMYAGHDRLHEQQIERLRDAVLASKKQAKRDDKKKHKGGADKKARKKK